MTLNDAVPAPRAASAIDALADAYVDDLVVLDPYTATAIGVAGHEREVTDLSPAGYAARRELDQRTLRELDAVVTASGGLEGGRLDATDRVTVAALHERLGLALEISGAGLDLGSLNVISSPLQGCQEIFDLMGTDDADQWSDIAARLTATPSALAGYTQSLRAAVAAGHPPAARQVRECVDTAARFAEPDGVFGALVGRARPDGREPSAGLAHDLEVGSRAAREAYADLSAFLRDEIAPAARATDAVGADEYALWSRDYLGARVDLADTYAWGLEEVARIEAEMAVVAEQILPGASAAEAIAHLEADPARRIEGTDALATWMQRLSDSALAALADVHFDIPGPVRRLDCRIAPSASGGIYYSGPSEDFSRPGTMWWSVPAGVTSFSTWRERTTVFHEGVPGHHLQIGQTLYRAELLNRWRRMLCWVSGHGEGWALYAERLMADLGWLDDPGDLMGMLDSSLFRATRVVVDIGLHCGFTTPTELGGGVWDAEAMWTYLRTHTFQQEDFLRFEHLRYLGWPGQAPSYKIGERLWLSLREEVRAREGGAFDLAAFHRRALDLGSLGLDALREAVLATPLSPS